MVRREDLEKRVIDIGMFRSFISAVDGASDWVSSVGETAKVFSDMMDDGRVCSLVEHRQNRVLWLDMVQKDGPCARLNDACRAALDFNKIQKLAIQLLTAIPNGISVTEVVWEQKGGIYVPAGFFPVPRSQLSFPLSGEDRQVPVHSPTMKRLDGPYKFLIHRNDRGTGNPWGRPVLRAAYWPWKFKKLGFKFWIMAAERIGVPSILAIFDAKNEEEVQKRSGKLAGLLSKFKSGSSAALANVKDVKYLDAAGALADFNVIVETCNTEIAYAVTGQSLATNQAEYGTKAQGELHERSFDAITYGDAQALQASIQTLYDWFAEINFPGEEPPRFEIDAGEKVSWKTLAEAVDRGIPVSRKAVYALHKIPEPENDADAFVKPQGAAPPPVGGEGFADKDAFFCGRAAGRTRAAQGKGASPAG